jgi:hypothetical protein
MNAKSIQRLAESIKSNRTSKRSSGKKDRRTRTYWRGKAEKARRKQGKVRYDTFRIEEHVPASTVNEEPEEPIVEKPEPVPPPLAEEEAKEEEDLFEEHRIYHFDLDFDPETQTLSSGGWYYKRARYYDAEQSECKRARK